MLPYPEAEVERQLDYWEILTTSYSHPTCQKIYIMRTDDWQRKVELPMTDGNMGSTIVSKRLLVVLFK